MRITLFGTRDSVYTRIVRLVLNAKSLDYNFVAADIFTGDGLPKDYARLHPFKRIPAIEVDGRAFYETDAIAHYLDQIGPEPTLVPVDAVSAARMRQIMRVVDSYGFRPLVWGVYVPLWWREGKQPREGDLAAGRRVLAALDDLAAEGLSGSRPTLAWYYLAAVLAVTDSVEPGTALIDGAPALRSWWNSFRGTPAMVTTRPNESHY